MVDKKQVRGCAQFRYGHRLALEARDAANAFGPKQLETSDVNTGNDALSFRPHRSGSSVIAENCKVKSISPRASAFDWPEPASVATY